MLGGNLRWTCIPSRGSSCNTPSTCGWLHAMESGISSSRVGQFGPDRFTGKLSMRNCSGSLDTCMDLTKSSEVFYEFVGSDSQPCQVFDPSWNTAKCLFVLMFQMGTVQTHGTQS